MRNLFRVSLLLVLAAASLLAKKPWSEEKAKKWYAKSAWLVGANYIPAEIPSTPVRSIRSSGGLRRSA